MAQAPSFIVAIGGTQRETSSSASALRFCCAEAERLGCRTALFSGHALQLPLYDPRVTDRGEAATALVAAMRDADGYVLASPGYHGGISGLVKNALDYSEDMARDDAPYFTGRAVGCISVGAGWQAGGPVVAALRAMVHALRGWPTPLAVQLNTAEPVFSVDGVCLNPTVTGQLTEMTRQVVEFARMRQASSS